MNWMRKLLRKIMGEKVEAAIPTIQVILKLPEIQDISFGNRERYDTDIGINDRVLAVVYMTNGTSAKVSLHWAHSSGIGEIPWGVYYSHGDWPSFSSVYDPSLPIRVEKYICNAVSKECVKRIKGKIKYEESINRYHYEKDKKEEEEKKIVNYKNLIR